MLRSNSKCMWESFSQSWRKNEGCSGKDLQKKGFKPGMKG